MRTRLLAERTRRVPLGISIASHSRLKSICSYMIWLPAVSPLFGGNGVLLAGEGGLQSVPCQGCAFHSRRKLRDSRKYSQLAEFGIAAISRPVAGDYVVKTLEQFVRILPGLASQCLRHHRCRRFGDGATRALKHDKIG